MAFVAPIIGAAAGAVGSLSAAQVATLAIGAISTIAQTAAQSSAAKAQSKAREQQIIQEQRAQRAKQEQQELLAAQQNEKEGRERFRAQVVGTKQRAAAEVAASEAGVGGASVDALIRDFKSQQNFLEESLYRQSQLNRQSLDLRQEAEAISSQSRINRLSTPIQGPSALGVVGSLGSLVIDTFGEE